MLAILLAYLDKLRGSSQRMFKSDGILIYGWVLAAILGHEWDALTLPLVLAAKLGEAPAWGGPLGAVLDGTPPSRKEWWQFADMSDFPTLSLGVRGLMWGMPMALLAYFDPKLLAMPLIYALAMPLSAWIGHWSRGHYPRWMGTGDPWARHEWVRGLIVGVLATLVTNYA